MERVQGFLTPSHLTTPQPDWPVFRYTCEALTRGVKTHRFVSAPSRDVFEQCIAKWNASRPDLYRYAEMPYTTQTELRDALQEAANLLSGYVDELRGNGDDFAGANVVRRIEHFNALLDNVKA